MLSTVFLTLAAALLQACTASPVLSPLPVSEGLQFPKPIPPKKDPWYTPPDKHWVSKPPGTLLRVREAPGNFTLLKHAHKVYNLMFRTTNSQNQSEWAVTTVFFPKSPAISKDGVLPLLSYLIPYESACLDASPSYSLSEYLAGERLNVAVRDNIVKALGNGWLVDIPDYEGPKASYFAGQMAGHATLDSIRAHLKVFAEHMPLIKLRYAMLGYSGGAQAVEFAAELQLKYAPELIFSGAALGGVPANALDFFRACSGTIWSGAVVQAIVGVMNQFDKVEQYAMSLLKREKRDEFLSAREMTIDESLRRFANKNISNYFKTGEDGMENVISKEVLASDCTMGNLGTPQMPMFIYQSIHDEAMPIKNTDVLVEQHCNNGTKITFERNTIGGHREGGVNAFRSVWRFLGEVMGGNYTTPSKCNITDTSYNFTLTSDGISSLRR
ncbi:secretory lipase-domain-containing protein [Pseudomassariella vexata]|uniref:Secretory lipase-domain-containing protein n=1 Tax=Pseudomassariella vexata TaxID=1141098 RepID=A0A1Y2EC45_9PEZI|nr:secretory lipase-domain-containing protein [Pseudomassariella vexata]ORY68874.1 secretory lipase-domain-containing protein [Pseudomassariella vexata]